MDPGQRISHRETVAILTSTARLRHLYPQIRIVFCLTTLPSEQKASVYGYWLLNASPIALEIEGAGRPWTILTVIDRENGNAAISVGSALDSILCDADLLAVLEKAKSTLAKRQYGKACKKIAEHLPSLLATAHRRLELITERPVRADVPNFCESPREVAFAINHAAY